jgi:Septum formation
MTDQPLPPDPAPASPAPTPPATSPEKPPSKIRTYLVGAVVVAVLAVGAYAISQNQLASDLSIGQCFDEPVGATDISTVVKHACTEAHDAEVFHVAEYTGDAFPIALSLDSFIDDTCVPAFATYVGEPFETATDFDLGYFYPDRESWNKGDRTFTCFVSRVDGAKMTQSVKAAAAS